MAGNKVTERTMIYQIGSAIQCGPYGVDFQILEEGALIPDGWFLTPEEANQFYLDQQAAEEQARIQAEIEANNAALAQANAGSNGTQTKPSTRKPKRTSADQPGDLGTDVTEADGDNADNPPAEGGDTDQGKE